MTVKAVRRLYVVLYVVAAVLGVVFWLFGWNVFSEIGAVIIVFAIWRATKVLRSIEWRSIGSHDWQGEKLNERALAWDAWAGVIGTLVNGFSIWIYKAICLFSAVILA